MNHMRKKGITITFNAPVVLTFVILCFAATLAGELTGGATTRAFFATYASSLFSPMTYVRMFTHVLGHANFTHFFGNIMYILILGPLLEERYGRNTITGVILITALVTSLSNMLIFPTTMLLGASGVVFAFILLASFTNFKTGEIPLTFLLVAVLYIGQEIYQGLFVQDNISNMAHILGGLVGAVIGYKLNRR